MAEVDSGDRSRERIRRDQKRASRFSDSSRDRSRERTSGTARSANRSTGCRVYVSNIPYEYRWQDMKDLFRSNVGDVSFVELFIDENEKSRGCGIVEFANEELAKKCLEVMNRFDIKGRKLVVKEDGGNLRDKYGQIIPSGKSKRGGRDEVRHMEDRYDDNRISLEVPESKWGNTYGLSAHFLESLRIDSPLCNRVFVANLEYNVDEKKLKEVFRLAGHIWNVDLSIDKDGRSRGFAVVEYDHPVEAVQAISMFNNQLLNDRPMTVRMDRVNEVLRLPDGLKAVGMGLGANGEPLRDIARNLPNSSRSSGNDTQQLGASNCATNGAMSNLSTGMFGSVQAAQALQVASALSSLAARPGGNQGSSGLNPQSILQAANLQSLLANNGIAGDLSTLAANFGGNLGTHLGDSRKEQVSSYGSGTGGMSTLNRDSGMGYKSVDDSSLLNKSMNAPLLRSTPRPQLTRNDTTSTGLPGHKELPAGMSRKVLVSNLPPTVSFKMLNDKFEEYGDVLHLEDKGNGSLLIVYSSDWQADRAIQNLDRARIDGRTIEAQFYF